MLQVCEQSAAWQLLPHGRCRRRRAAAAASQHSAHAANLTIVPATATVAHARQQARVWQNVANGRYVGGAEPGGRVGQPAAQAPGRTGRWGRTGRMHCVAGRACRGRGAAVKWSAVLPAAMQHGVCRPPSDLAHTPRQPAAPFPRMRSQCGAGQQAAAGSSRQQLGGRPPSTHIQAAVAALVAALADHAVPGRRALGAVGGTHGPPPPVGQAGWAAAAVAPPVGAVGRGGGLGRRAGGSGGRGGSRGGGRAPAGAAGGAVRAG